MPIYEYMCPNCQKVHEVMQKFSDAPLDKCPDCQSPVQKLVSLSSFALKGTGWYTTDYKRAPTAKSGETKSDSAAISAVGGSPSSAPNGTTVTPSGSAANSTSSTSGNTSGSASNASGNSSGPTSNSGRSTSSGKPSEVKSNPIAEKKST